MLEKKVSKTEWLIAVVLFAFLYIVSDFSGQIVIAVAATLLAFFVYAFYHRFIITFRFDMYNLYILIISFYCFLSCLWALDSYLSMVRGILLLQIFLSMFVFSLIFNNSQYISDLLSVIKWGNYLVLLYAFLAYGWNRIVYVLQNESRVNNDFINANVLGMCAAYAVVINFYFILYDKFKLNDLLVIPAVIMLAASGSRKALVILVAGIFAVFILKNFDFKRIINSIIRVFLVVLVLIMVFLLLSRISIFEGIIDRMIGLITTLSGGVGDSSSLIRLQYNRLGWQLFLQHPIVGIGIDNARLYTSSIYGYNHYLHNNFIELLACGGSIGFLLYYSIYIYIFYAMIKYHKERDKEWDICFILLVIRLVMDYGAVSYETRGTYIYLLLFWLEVKKLKRRAQSEKRIDNENKVKIGEIV